MSLNTQNYSENYDPRVIPQAEPVQPSNSHISKENKSSEGSISRSDIGPSSSTPLVIEFVASHPNLMVNTGQNVLSQAASAYKDAELVKFTQQIASEHNRIMNDILDQWSEQVAEDAKRAKEADDHHRVQEAGRRLDQIQNDAKKAIVEFASLQQEIIGSRETKPLAMEAYLGSNAVFNEFWNKASSTEKLKLSGKIAKAVIEQHPASFGAQLEDAKKMAPYLAPLVVAFITEMQINFLANQLASATTNPFSLNTTVSQLQTPHALEGTSQINLLLPLFAASKDTAMAFNQAGKPTKELFDAEFVKEFAKKVLGRVKTIESWLSNISPELVKMGQEQLKAVTAASSLIALTTVLVLDVKSQGEASNLTAEEFKSMLSSTVPGYQELNNVTSEINSILRQFPPNERVEYVNMVLDFIDRAPKTNINELRHLPEALLAANAEIAPALRTINTTES